MRWPATVVLYLCYIQSFCEYLLTGKYSLWPADPAGMLWHTPQLNQVLARPDGELLCALFALGCYGFVSFVETVLEPWLFGAASNQGSYCVRASDHPRYHNLTSTPHGDNGVRRTDTTLPPHNVTPK